jgi:uncharacterized protein
MLRIRHCLPCLSCFALLLFLSAPLRAEPDTFEEMVAMPDGVQLYTQIWLPSGAAPYTTLLLRTPYVEDYMDYLGMLTNFGYAIVVQHTRGAGNSEGEADVFFSDAEDGVVAMDWLLAQPWSDGRVVMGGASAIGIPAYVVAPSAPDEMVCQIVAIATPDLYSHATFHGGVFKEKDVTSWSSWTGASAKLDELAEHRLCDASWDPVRVQDQGAAVRAAAAHVGGWFDVFSEGTLAGFQMYRGAEDPDVADRQYLVMGPWTHFEIGTRYAGDVLFPKNAEFNLISAVVSWLDWCVDGDNAAVDGWARVRYYVMGDVDDPEAPGNEWREADDWPIPSEERRLHLAPEGLLQDAPPPDDALLEIVFPFDPADPSPTKGGRNLTMKGGPVDQAPVEARDDAVVFTTPVLEEPLEIVGRVSARLTIRIDAPDADLAVRLTDVYPDGRSMLVTEGIQRLSMRAGCEASIEVPVGAPVEVEVDLWSTAYAFAPGHRLRVIVSGSNHPRYEVNPTLAAPLEDGNPAPAVDITLVSREGAPSFLSLPVPLPVEEPVEPGEDVEEGEEAEEIAAPDAPEEITAPDEAAEAVDELPAPDVAQVDASQEDVASDLTADQAAAQDLAEDVILEGGDELSNGDGCAWTVNPAPKSLLTLLMLLLTSVGLLGRRRPR